MAKKCLMEKAARLQAEKVKDSDAKTGHLCGSVVDDHILRALEDDVESARIEKHLVLVSRVA